MLSRRAPACVQWQSRVFSVRRKSRSTDFAEACFCMRAWQKEVPRCHRGKRASPAARRGSIAKSSDRRSGEGRFNERHITVQCHSKRCRQAMADIHVLAEIYQLVEKILTVRWAKRPSPRRTPFSSVWLWEWDFPQKIGLPHRTRCRVRLTVREAFDPLELCDVFFGSPPLRIPRTVERGFFQARFRGFSCRRVEWFYDNSLTQGGYSDAGRHI